MSDLEGVIRRKTTEILVCDYCQYRKCRWTKYTPSDPPDDCYKVKTFKIADDYLDEGEFERRLEIAKRIGDFDSEESVWHLAYKEKNPLMGRKLREVMEEVNEWSGENDFQLSRFVEYEEKEKSLDEYG